MAKSREAFRTISEVADWLDVQTHVLRFWESKFSQVKPVKRAGGRRYYRPQDMELLGGLKKLLHEDGLPIKEAQQLLREKGVKHVSSLSRPVDQDQDDLEDVAEVAADDTVTPPEDDAVQEEISPPEEAVTVDAAQAVGEPALSEDQTDAIDHQSEIVSESLEAEVVSKDSEAELDTTPDETATDLPDAATESAEDDGFLDDLLVKVDHEGTPATSEPEIETTPQTAASAADDSSAVPADDVAHAASAPEQQAPIDQATPDQTPPIDDLFAAVDAPTEGTQTTQSNPDVEALEAAASEDTLPLSSNAQGSAPQIDPAGMTTEAADANQAGDTAITGSSALISPDGTVLPSADLTPAEGAPVTKDPDVAAPVEPKPAAPNETAASAGRSVSTSKPASAPDAASNTQAASNAAAKPDVETMIARENTRDDFLLMLTQPVTVAPKDASRAADLLARLQALHSKAG
ncbi:MerR family transcriptional regulator [uncultured Shimia sp.]|uniref:MerR family transcriptional regulator n=1 Tax=uncultured Shimia sp. TaxID=573152 RepID=UPI0025F508F2|nr:MerR family transcriptional regulator [uncultured Shimia sp.]